MMNTNPLNKDEMLNALKTNLVKISFKKKNDEIREMTCTLLSSFLPEMKSDKSKKKNDNMQSVWDVDSNAWRSFLWDNLLSFEVIRE